MRSFRTGIVCALFALAAAAPSGCGDPPAADEGLKPSDPQFRYRFIDIHKPFFEKTRGAGGALVHVPKRPGSSAPSFPATKAPRTKRVFIVGGSVAQRLDSDPYPFRKLAAPYLPGWKLEVVDCGMASYDSYRTALVFKEILGLEPDLIIVLTGNNESYGDVRVNRIAFGINAWLRKLGPYRRLQDRRRASRPAESRTGPARRAALEKNLKGMLRAAERGRVPVVLCALPNNLSGAPPRAWPGRPDWKNPAFVSAWIALMKPDPKAAASAFSALAEKRPADPYVLFLLGRALELAGSRAEAAEAYRRSLDFQDGRCGPAINAIIRRVCRESPACALADIEAAFRRLAPGGIAGGAIFNDGVHWRLEHNSAAAHAILDALRSRDASGAKPSFAAPEDWSVAAPARLAPLEHGIPPPFLYGVEAVADFAGRQDPAVEFFRAALRRDPDAAGLVEKDRLRKRLAASPWPGRTLERLDREWPRILEHMGEALRLSGRAEDAIRLLDEALRLEPGLCWARVHRALARAQLGLKEKSREDLAAARVPACETKLVAELLLEREGTTSR